MKPIMIAAITVMAVFLFGAVLDSQSFRFRRGGGQAVVCQKFVAEKNCHKCSDYFYAESEEEADKKCEDMGYDQAYYFPRVAAVFRWMLSNCDCASDGQ